MSKITNPDGGGEIHPIKKGEKRGRKPGVPNKITTLIKDAAMAAIEEVGTPVKAYDKQGKFIGWMPTGDGGVKGYFMHVACVNEGAMMGLVGKILPHQINVKSEHNHNVRIKTFDEIIEIMKAKGIPESMWPQRMLAPPREEIEGEAVV